MPPQKKALTLLYTDSIVKAYKMFSMDESFEGITNVYDLNRHPNETMVVDDALYHAFELIAETGNRAIYLAPVYTEYDNLFFCNDDSETVNYDAYQNGEVAAYFSEVAAYSNDPSDVNVELLGGNQVRLSVSDDYLAFAEKNFISDFIDFSWMKNAFITDYVADVMIDNGYTLGSLTSYDGFTRNLDQTSAITKLNAGPDTSGTAGKMRIILSIYMTGRGISFILPVSCIMTGRKVLSVCTIIRCRTRKNIIIMNLRAVISGPVMQIPQTDCVSPQSIIWQLMRTTSAVQNSF